jgi:hypothetical protein
MLPTDKGALLRLNRLPLLALVDNVSNIIDEG